MTGALWLAGSGGLVYLDDTWPPALPSASQECSAVVDNAFQQVQLLEQGATLHKGGMCMRFAASFPSKGGVGCSCPCDPEALEHTALTLTLLPTEVRRGGGSRCGGGRSWRQESTKRDGRCGRLSGVAGGAGVAVAVAAQADGGVEARQAVGAAHASAEDHEALATRRSHLAHQPLALPAHLLLRACAGGLPPSI